MHVVRHDPSSSDPAWPGRLLPRRTNAADPWPKAPYPEKGRTKLSASVALVDPGQPDEQRGELAKGPCPLAIHQDRRTSGSASLARK